MVLIDIGFCDKRFESDTKLFKLFYCKVTKWTERDVHS
jgi:hypothetical protein